MKPGVSYKRAGRSRCCSRTGGCGEVKGRSSSAILSEPAAAHGPGGLSLSSRCALAGGTRRTVLPGKGCSPFLLLGRRGASPGALPPPGLAGSTEGWPSSLQALLMTAVGSCCTSRTQCLSPSHPKHKVQARCCSRSGRRQHCPSCRLFPVATWWALWVAFQEPHLSLLSLASFFY